jgi:hypothetical protein
MALRPRLTPGLPFSVDHHEQTVVDGWSNKLGPTHRLEPYSPLAALGIAGSSRRSSAWSCANPTRTGEIGPRRHSHLLLRVRTGREAELSNGLVRA